MRYPQTQNLSSNFPHSLMFSAEGQLQIEPGNPTDKPYDDYME